MKGMTPAAISKRHHAVTVVVVTAMTLLLVTLHRRWPMMEGEVARWPLNEVGDHVTMDVVVISVGEERMSGMRITVESMLLHRPKVGDY